MWLNHWKQVKNVIISRQCPFMLWNQQKCGTLIMEVNFHNVPFSFPFYRSGNARFLNNHKYAKLQLNCIFDIFALLVMQRIFFVCERSGHIHLYGKYIYILLFHQFIYNEIVAVIECDQQRLQLTFICKKKKTWLEMVFTKREWPRNHFLCIWLFCEDSHYFSSD